MFYKVNLQLWMRFAFLKKWKISIDKITLITNMELWNELACFHIPLKNQLVHFPNHSKGLWNWRPPPCHPPLNVLSTYFLLINCNHVEQKAVEVATKFGKKADFLLNSYSSVLMQCIADQDQKATSWRWATLYYSGLVITQKTHHPPTGLYLKLH